MPKLGALLPKALGKVYCNSVSDFFGKGNRDPFPKENFYLAVEKFAVSFEVTKPPCLELKIVDIFGKRILI